MPNNNNEIKKPEEHGNNSLTSQSTDAKTSLNNNTSDQASRDEMRKVFEDILSITPRFSSPSWFNALDEASKVDSDASEISNDNNTKNNLCTNVGTGFNVVTQIGLNAAIVATTVEAAPLAVAIAQPGVQKAGQAIGVLTKAACQEVYPIIQEKVNSVINTVSDTLNSPGALKSEKVAGTPSAQATATPPAQPAAPAKSPAPVTVTPPAKAAVTPPAQPAAPAKSPAPVTTTPPAKATVTAPVPPVTPAKTSAPAPTPPAKGAVIPAPDNSKQLIEQEVKKDLTALENNDKQLATLIKQYEDEKKKYETAVQDHNKRMQDCNAAINQAIAAFKAGVPNKIESIKYELRKCQRTFIPKFNKMIQDHYDHFNNVTIRSICASYGFTPSYAPLSPNACNQVVDKIKALQATQKNLATKIKENLPKISTSLSTPSPAQMQAPTFTRPISQQAPFLEQQRKIAAEQIEKSNKQRDDMAKASQAMIQRSLREQQEASRRSTEEQQRAAEARMKAQVDSFKTVYEPHIHQARMEMQRGGNPNPSSVGLFRTSNSNTSLLGVGIQCGNGPMSMGYVPYSKK